MLSSIFRASFCGATKTNVLAHTWLLQKKFRPQNNVNNCVNRSDWD
jgi:hypothetical protein